MATTKGRAPRTITVFECNNCGVDKDVHVIDGCSDPDYYMVRVCPVCFEAPYDCEGHK